MTKWAQDSERDTNTKALRNECSAQSNVRKKRKPKTELFHWQLSFWFRCRSKCHLDSGAGWSPAHPRYRRIHIASRRKGNIFHRHVVVPFLALAGLWNKTGPCICLLSMNICWSITEMSRLFGEVCLTWLNENESTVSLVSWNSCPLWQIFPCILIPTKQWTSFIHNSETDARSFFYTNCQNSTDQKLNKITNESD